ncbi:MFS transporter [Roseomonas haemaphysalidis]|uniref:MFS transporter n=1 Tax=Roseomonas haemaphysalidis TaxID=2768162 RepID=A0ABS3KUH7_9PROT|nr:MFS transporter [Roseomonas haemaphysalidis]MBO1081116.1 MFS transporter [Roseomonas haemaphysalidis]
MTAAAAAPNPAAVLPLLALAAFATGCGMRLLDPLLPVVAADLGVSVAEATVVIAAFTLPYGFCQILLGPLGDRLGKLRVMVAGLLLYGIAMAGCALAASLGHLVGLRAVTGALGGAIVPLAMAWIGDNVPYAERQATLGRFLTGMVMAQLLTGPLAGIAGQAFGWRAVFLLVGAQAALTALAIVATLRARLWRAEPAGGGSGLARYIALLQRPAGRRLLGVAFVNGALLWGGALPFIGSFLIQGFHLEQWHAGLVVAGFGIGSFVYTRIARTLLLRFGEARVMFAGGLLLAAGIAAIGVAPRWEMVAALQAMLGLAFFMFHGALQARSTELMPEARATSVSAFVMALFLGQAFGAILFGALMARVGYGGAFVAGGCAMAALAVTTRMVLAGR